MALVDLIEMIARPTVGALLNGLWQGTLLAALVWCLLKAIPRLNATTRYVIWWSTLIAVICLPIVAARTPLLSMDDPAKKSNGAPDDSSEIVFSFEAPRAANGISSSNGAGSRNLTSSSEPTIESTGLSEAGEQARPREIDAAFFPVRLPARWAVFLFAAWMLIVFVMMGRVAWSYCYLTRLKRSCSPLVDSFPESLKLRLAYARVRRRFEMRSSEQTSVPMVIGLVKPVIVIPQAIARQLTEEEFEQVVLHEVAHVRRRDDWMKLLQRLIEAFLFFHPAVLWIGRQLNLEREIACDDSVISLTGRPRPYAACLVKLLELAASRQSSLLAPGAVTIKRQISSRVEMIVDKRRNATLTLSKASLFIMLIALALVVAQAARISPALALTEPTAAQSLSTTQSLKDEFNLSQSVATNNHSSRDSLIEADDKLIALRFETTTAQPSDATQFIPIEATAWRGVKQAQGSMPEPPRPPAPPRPPDPPPVSPSIPVSVPAPPAPPSDPAREAHAVFDRLMADYNQSIAKYRQQMREYERDVEKHREQMREYDRRIAEYGKELKRYYIEMEQYNRDMKEYEKRIFAMVPGAILNVISEQIAALDIKLEAIARDKLDSELQQIAAVLARDLTEKLKDLKINRPAGHITIVSLLSTGVLRNRLRELFNSLEIDRDEATRAGLGIVADRAAPALQSLVVYRWPS